MNTVSESKSILLDDNGAASLIADRNYEVINKDFCEWPSPSGLRRFSSPYQWPASTAPNWPLNSQEPRDLIPQHTPALKSWDWDMLLTQVYRELIPFFFFRFGGGYSFPDPGVKKKKKKKVKPGIKGWGEKRVLHLINVRTVSQGPFNSTLHYRAKSHSQTRGCSDPSLVAVCELVKAGA